LGESTEESAGIETRVEGIYRVEYKSVEFVSDEERESWREPLERLLSSLQPEEYLPDAGIYDGYIFGSDGVGMIDINCDGVPEVAEWYRGGTMMNTEYVIYDLFTGEKVAEYTAGAYGSYGHGYVVTAFDREDGVYRLIGKGIHRCGWSSGDTFVNVFVKDEDGGYHAKTVLYHGSNVERVEESTDTDGTPRYDYSTTAYFRILGETVDHQSYYFAASSFDERMMEIAETAMDPLYWRNFEAETQAERAVLVAEALLSSAQKFVKPYPN
jgi:hypothetical protein